MASPTIARTLLHADRMSNISDLCGRRDIMIDASGDIYSRSHTSIKAGQSGWWIGPDVHAIHWSIDCGGVAPSVSGVPGRGGRRT
ncbi:hypothetical protein PHLGIDRAFT_141761 [Phlebiopsis gigantea 11061_1 CR5-6]|uniref:Uncharacterized protein n=1 Tax=Phlebiopsis gigantea (strain 11061_1 CR5-6) TaxID=745531 RepID=A0A0C3PUI0_PHLG1|nr:hypothetical protein PHLGIDRAFT_141761 [Phlebiopsis gigantea 11061_1 CR5-6]